MGIRDLCRIPKAAVRHSRAKQISVIVGIVEGSGGYRVRGVSIRVKLFYLETRGTRLGDRHVAKRSSDPWVAYPEVKVQVRDLMRVVGIVSPLSHGGGWGLVFGENSFYRAQGVNGHSRPVPGAPRSSTPRENQAKFRDGTVREL